MSIFSRPAHADTGSRRNDATGLTIIAQGTTIVGDVGSDAVVKIEGTIQGTVRAGSQLLISPGAVVRGDVFAAEIIVGGEIHGCLYAEERVEIQAGALVNGDIRTQRIHVTDGGRVNGQISMEPAASQGQSPVRALSGESHIV